MYGGQIAGITPMRVMLGYPLGGDAQQGDSSFDGHVALGLVGLRVVGHVMGSRRFYEKVAVATIVLVALRWLRPGDLRLRSLLVQSKRRSTARSRASGRDATPSFW